MTPGGSTRRVAGRMPLRSWMPALIGASGDPHLAVVLRHRGGCPGGLPGIGVLVPGLLCGSSLREAQGMVFGVCSSPRALRSGCPIAPHAPPPPSPPGSPRGSHRSRPAPRGAGCEEAPASRAGNCVFHPCRSGWSSIPARMESNDDGLPDEGDLAARPPHPHDGDGARRSPSRRWPPASHQAECRDTIRPGHPASPPFSPGRPAPRFEFDPGKVQGLD